MAKFNFKKSLGQNFLNDGTDAKRIAESISPNEDDLIIEIGPGAGSITKLLKKHKSQLVAFELDQDTKKYLLPLADEKTKIIYQDFLTTDLSQILSTIKYNDLYIVGNLPYYITTPIIEHIIDSQIVFKEMVIMVQKEVADRFLAKPHSKEYGYMTVLLNYNFNMERILEIDKSKFYPIPKVDSTVLKFRQKENIEKIDYDKFKKLLKDSFQFKRKTINNNLRMYNIEQIEGILTKHGYTLQNRSEEIDLDTFIDITKHID